MDQGSPVGLASPKLVWDHNLRALKKANPKLADELERAKPLKPAVRLPRPGGLPNIPFGLPERPLYYKDNSSLESVCDELEGLETPVARVVVFLGLGLGYQLAWFTQQHAMRLKTERIVVIERSLERFRMALEVTDMSGLLADQRLLFLVGLNQEALFARLLDLFRTPAFISRLTALTPLYHPGDLVEARDYYLNALRQVREAASEAAHLIGNSPEDSLIGLKNMLANLRTIAENPGLALLGSAFAGRPAILVSTGPSLNKNIRQLAELQHRALILAVDASVAPLAKAGVDPHLVVSLERVPAVAELVRGFDLRASYLAACPVVRPEVYEAYQGPKLIVYRNLSHFAWLNLEKGTLSTGPSAANMAFKIAEYLGCDPIVLVGQDLAFGEEGTTHAHHAVLGENQEAFHRQRVFEIPANSGGTVRTTEVWLRFLKHFQADVQAFKGTCINATEGGALIPGTRVMSLREAAQSFMQHPFDASDIISERLRQFQPDSKVHTHLAQTVEEGKAEIQEIIGMCERGAERAGRFVEKYAHLLDEGAELDHLNPKRVERDVQRVFQVRQRVEELHPRAYRLFMGLTLQPYLVTFEHRVAQLPKQFPDTVRQQIAWGYMHLEWFTRVAQLSRLCLTELEAVDLGDLMGLSAAGMDR